MNRKSELVKKIRKTSEKEYGYVMVTLKEYNERKSFEMMEQSGMVQSLIE
jgi:hypothetical protein